ncbi:MAG: ATP-binding cassette domain-containing protein [Roseibium sp.]
MRNAGLDMPANPSTGATQDTRDVLLQSRALSYDVTGQPLLSHIDLTIRRGSRTVIMGPNGAGKSLLLRLLHGLITPRAGKVLWQGRPLNRSDRQAQAMVFQRPVLLRRSVFANMKFALSVQGFRGLDRADQIKQALETAGLAHLARRPARVLSGGEQQRLAVVRALACKPDLLFLDEPTASLDPASTAAIEKLVLEANANGVTIVLVTHDAGQARRIGEEIVFLQDGKIVEIGPVQSVLTNPQSEPVRAWREGRLYIPQHTHDTSNLT